MLPDRREIEEILHEGNFESLSFYSGLVCVFKKGNDLDQARTLAYDFFKQSSMMRNRKTLTRNPFRARRCTARFTLTSILILTISVHLTFVRDSTLLVN